MRYIGKNIYYTLRNQKKMFVFMVMVQIASIMLFIYCFGVIQSNKMKKEWFYDAQCEFQLRFVKRDRSTDRLCIEEKYKFSNMRKIIDEMRSDMGDEIIYVRIGLTESEEALNNMEIKSSICNYNLTKESHQIMCKESGKSLFSWGEMEDGCGRVYVNSQVKLHTSQQGETGEAFVLSGKQFEIIRKPYIHQIQLAYGDIPDDVYVTALDIYLINAPNMNKQEEVNEKLKSWFEINEQNIKQPYKFDDLLSIQYIALAICVNVFICFIILVNALLIYSYMLKKRKKWIFVMHLNGCSLGRIFFYFVVEMAIIMILCLVSALLLYHNIIFPVAGGDVVVNSVIYEGNLYLYSLISFVIVTILGCLICAKVVISNYRKKMVSVLEEAKLWEN